MLDKARKAFEAWGSEDFYSGLARISDTWDADRQTYNNFGHHMAWCAWQAALQWAASQQAAEGWKLVGYTCGDGDCGRIHDEMDEEDGYMQPVYVRAAPTAQGERDEQ